MQIKHDTLPEHHLGGQRQLSHFHFGAPGTGEKAYLQAGLHAGGRSDENRWRAAAQRRRRAGV